MKPTLCRTIYFLLHWHLFSVSAVSFYCGVPHFYTHIIVLVMSKFPTCLCNSSFVLIQQNMLRPSVYSLSPLHDQVGKRLYPALRGCRMPLVNHSFNALCLQSVVSFILSVRKDWNKNTDAYSTYESYASHNSIFCNVPSFSFQVSLSTNHTIPSFAVFVAYSCPNTTTNNTPQTSIPKLAISTLIPLSRFRNINKYIY